MNDLKFAVRQLLRNPGFTAVAVLTLALGIAANAAIFSVVHGVLLRPLPYGDADRIVAVWTYNTAAYNASGVDTGHSSGNYRLICQMQRSFSHLAGSRSGCRLSCGQCSARENNTGCYFPADPSEITPGVIFRGRAVGPAVGFDRIRRSEA